jgi:hypothetical protein
LDSLIYVLYLDPYEESDAFFTTKKGHEELIEHSRSRVTMGTIHEQIEAARDLKVGIANSLGLIHNLTFNQIGILAAIPGTDISDGNPITQDSNNLNSLTGVVNENTVRGKSVM